jgi:acyl CoA:acetate/3-ketoacid CoA transferase beta subunit
MAQPPEDEGDGCCYCRYGSAIPCPYSAAGWAGRRLERRTKAGKSKLVERCSHPRTGIMCASRVYTGSAVIDITLSGMSMVQMYDGLSFETLPSLTAVPLLAQENRP